MMQPLGAFSVPADHPCLPGHFPGSPIVPGVLLLDEIAGLVLRHHPGFRFAAVAQTRFLLPVLPDQVVHVAAAPSSTAMGTMLRVAFSGEVAGTLVVKGSLDLRAAA
ncbi:MAG TPA: hypothetical protein VE684_19710 [Crenalkalicoccus sp.]|nr:hypothetical protein [Crenalkalicoccus sp.]